MEKGADQENLKRAPLCGKLHYTTTKQEPLCLSLSFFLSLSLPPSGLVVTLNLGYARTTHVTSAGFVVSNACDMAIAHSSSPGIALIPPRVGSEVKAGFHPFRRCARTQVGSCDSLFLVAHPLLCSYSSSSLLLLSSLVLPLVLPPMLSLLLPSLLSPLPSLELVLSHVLLVDTPPALLLPLPLVSSVMQPLPRRRREKKQELTRVGTTEVSPAMTPWGNSDPTKKSPASGETAHAAKRCAPLPPGVTRN
jgi:hypothetical protein